MKKWKNNENRYLLFYGDTITNIADILINGISNLHQIKWKSSDEEYKNGNGGIEMNLTDCCTDAAMNCRTTQTFNIGFIILCEVAVDEQDWLLSELIVLDDGLKIPNKAGVGTGHKFQVHDMTKIKMKYLVKLNFDHEQLWQW